MFNFSWRCPRWALSPWYSPAFALTSRTWAVNCSGASRSISMPTRLARRWRTERLRRVCGGLARSGLGLVRRVKSCTESEWRPVFTGFICWSLFIWKKWNVFLLLPLCKIKMNKTLCVLSNEILVIICSLVASIIVEYRK